MVTFKLSPLPNRVVGSYQQFSTSVLNPIVKSIEQMIVTNMSTYEIMIYFDT